MNLLMLVVKLQQIILLVNLQAENAEVNIAAAAVITNLQKLSQTIQIIHSADKTNSSIKSRTLVGGKANHFVKMQTDMLPNVKELGGFQNHKALLMSDTASVRVQPVLAIATDDVTCAHGATVGELDAKAKFYLQSRGLNKAEAEQLLATAFVRAIFSKQFGIEDYIQQTVQEVING